MSLRIDTSAQFVWAIANTEANLAGETRIEPVHFFLGILKVIDPNFLRQIQDVELSDEDRRLLAEASKHVRQYLEMSVDDVTQLRRALRRDLRDKESEKPEIHMLHRSDESRRVFQAAAEKAVQSGSNTLSVLHLTESLFETESVSLEGMKKLKARVSSKGARWEVVGAAAKKPRHRFPEWFGRNLSRLAAEGVLPPFVGRDAEIRLVLRILARTGRRNAAILGMPGIGKTALVEGVAAALLAPKLPESLRQSQILEIHGSDIASDCENEAELSKRLLRLFAVLQRHKSAILLVDDFQGLFPPHLKPETALALLTTILSDSMNPCLITTTADRWNKLKTLEPSFARQFHVVQMDTPSSADCKRIADAWIERIGALQGIGFSSEVRDAVLKAADSLPIDRAFPDRIVDLLENIGTYLKVSALSSKDLRSDATVGDIQAVLAEHYGVRQVKAPRSISEL